MGANIENPCTFSDVPRKELSQDEQERVREALRVLLRDRFDGNQSALMRAHPAFKQSHVSRLLRGEAAPGWGLARRLAAILGKTPDELVSGRAAPALGPRFRDIPNWTEAEREALADSPELADAIRAAGDAYLPEPIPSISAESIIEFALWLKRIKRRAARETK